MQTSLFSAAARPEAVKPRPSVLTVGDTFALDGYTYEIVELTPDGRVLALDDGAYLRLQRSFNVHRLETRLGCRVRGAT